jgi:hypothetical protein
MKFHNIAATAVSIARGPIILLIREDDHSWDHQSQNGAALPRRT